GARGGRDRDGGPRLGPRRSTSPCARGRSGGLPALEPPWPPFLAVRALPTLQREAPRPEDRGHRRCVHLGAGFSHVPGLRRVDDPLEPPSKSREAPPCVRNESLMIADDVRPCVARRP